MDNAPFAATNLYYRHSGRFSPAGVVKALVLGSLVAIPLGAAYAYIDLYNPVAGWITFIVTGGTGFFMGWIIAGFLKSGKVRNGPLTILITTLVAGLMLLSSWEVWLYAVLRQAGVNQVGLLDIVLRPSLAWEILAAVNARGAWALKDMTPTGLFLDILWLAEAGALLGIPLAFAWRTIHEFPFCEKCNKWCASRDLMNLKPGDAAALRAKLEARDFSALTALGKAQAASMHFWHAYFQGCADCDTTQTLCIDDHALTTDKNGKLHTTKKAIISRLVLSPEDTVAVATAIAMLTPAPAPEPAPDPADPVPEKQDG